MKKLYFIGLFISIATCCFAQKGTVTVIKDAKIDSLIAKRMEVYRATESPSNAAKPLVSEYGYRVQVYYGSDRREVFNQQNRFRNENSGINTYIIYKEPNYYLRVGDFRTRLEAQRLMNEIRPSFPTLFIFREKINAPNLDTPTNDEK